MSEVAWRFRCYHDEKGFCEVEYVCRDPEIDAALETKLRILRHLPANKWGDWAEQLKGKCDGIVALRFPAKKVEQRPLGFFRPNFSFVFVSWATEKNGKYKPPSYCETALDRKGIVQTTLARAHECFEE